VLDGAFQLGFRHLRTAPDAPTAGFVVELLLRAPPRGDTQPSRDQITIRLVLLLIGVIPGTVVGRTVPVSPFRYSSGCCGPSITTRLPRSCD
jgi:hypothetical protein